MKRRLLAVLAAIAVGAGLVAAGGSAAAAPTTVAKYVALGDSIAAGQGGGVPLDACARTDGGYASQLDDVPKVNLLRHPACSGATIGDTAAQLSQVNRGTTLVTLTVGANDLGLDAIYAQCAAVPAVGDLGTCYAATQAAVAAAAGLSGPLEMLIGEIARRAPNATIVVTGYPHLIEPVDLLACTAVLTVGQCLPLVSLADSVNEATDALNSAIEGAAEAAAAGGAKVVYADVVDAFAGYGISLLGPGDPWFGTDPVNDPAGFLHPTYEGYAAYTQVILSKLNP